MATVRPDPHSPGTVTLALPADPRLIRVVRLAVSGLAAELGFNLDEIEDLKLAIGEACTDRLEHAPGATLTVRLSYGDGELTAEVAGDGPDVGGAGEVGEDDPSGFALALVEALTDRVEREVDGAGITVLRMTKSAAGALADGGPGGPGPGME
ncbi:MAG TPA: ATP-binding protein [Armatimonadota bacterium]|nr:ATP-binding protein [Armatimonadota bacterium]